MNNDLLYTLDPYIIATLFQVNDEKIVLERYNMVLEDVVEVTESTLKEYLLENKFNEAEIDELLKIGDFDKANPKFKPYLQNIIFINRVNDNVKLLLKTYYDGLLVKLKPEKRAELDQYIKDNQEILEKKDQLVKDGLGIISKILTDNGVETIDELEKKIGPIKLEENVENVSSPSINLGGVNTMTQVPNKAIPEAIPTTINGGVLADMSVPSVTPVETTEPPTQESNEEVVATQTDFGTSIVDMAAEPIVPESASVAEISSNAVPVTMPGDMMNINPVVDTPRLVKEQPPERNIMEGSAVVLPPVPPTPNHTDKSIESSSNGASKYASFLDNTLPPLQNIEKPIPVG